MLSVEKNAEKVFETLYYKRINLLVLMHIIIIL